MSKFEWTSTTPINETNLNKMIDMMYPVGSIYLSVNDTNPQTIFGGTWEQIKDRFLLSAGDTYSNGSTGGEATHVLTSLEMPSHTHNFRFNAGSEIEAGEYNSANLNGDTYPKLPSFALGSTWGSVGSVGIAENGASHPHNNMPPYLTVYMWKRIS